MHPAFNSFACILRGELIDHNSFEFLRDLHIIFFSVRTILHSHQKCNCVPISPHLFWYCVFFYFLPPSISSCLPSLPPFFFFLYYPSSWVGKTHETLTWDLKASMKALRQKKKKIHMCHISPIHSATIVIEGNGNAPDLASPVSPVKTLPHSTMCKFWGNLGSWCPPTSPTVYAVLSSLTLCCPVIPPASTPSCQNSTYSFKNIYILAVLGLHCSIWASL